MANVSRIRGFVPVRHINGGPYNAQTLECLLLTGTESTNCFIGDVVQWAGTAGAAGTVISGRNCEGMPGIIHSTNTTTGAGIAGVIVGFVQDQTLPLKYYNASSGTTGRIAIVEVSKDTVYEVQENGVTNNVVAANISAMVAIASGAGSTTTGLSAYTIVSTGTATTNTYPCQILGLVSRPDNAFGLSSTDLAKFEVIFNAYPITGV
jgi:hypothetical protein